MSDNWDTYLESIKQLTDEHLIPREQDMVRRGEVPDDVLGMLRESGLFGISVPEEYGGRGLSMEQQVLLTFEFTRASVVYRSRFSPNIGLCTQGILHFGTDEQKEELLPSMAAGSCIVSFALTEPEAGSDAAVHSVAVEQDGRVSISGEKRYITNAAWADRFIVFARTIDRDGTDRGVSAYIVDADADGVEVRLPDRMNGHAEAPVAEISLRDVAVDRSRLLGTVGEGMKIALTGINAARTHVGATSVGQATRLLEEMTRHAMTREQFGRPIIEFGAVEAMIGESFAELSAARALTLVCAQAQDRGQPSRADISAAKLFGTEMVGRVADRAVQVLGGEGIVGDSPVPRMWRDVRALRIYEGTSEIHRRNLARLVRRQYAVA